MIWRRRAVVFGSSRSIPRVSGWERTRRKIKPTPGMARSMSRPRVPPQAAGDMIQHATVDRHLDLSTGRGGSWIGHLLVAGADRPPAGGLLGRHDPAKLAQKR